MERFGVCVSRDGLRSDVFAITTPFAQRAMQRVWFSGWSVEDPFPGKLQTRSYRFEGETDKDGNLIYREQAEVPPPSRPLCPSTQAIQIASGAAITPGLLEHILTTLRAEGHVEVTVLEASDCTPTLACVLFGKQG